MATQDGFEHIADREYFDNMLLSLGGVAANRELFDFRDPELKRSEFNRIRDNVFASLISRYSSTCQLCCHADCTGIASQVDHLIPLSSNSLNKEIRGLRGGKGKKAPAQSFGSNDYGNLVLACARCNAFKKHRLPSAELIQHVFSLREQGPDGPGGSEESPG